MLQSGQVLAAPATCPPHVYCIMCECWRAVPAARLTASQLHRRLVADHARIADEVLAAAQRHGQDIWIEKLRIETREARQS